MAKFIMEGFGISNASFDQKGLSLDVDKIDFVLTTNSATSFSYEYTGSHQSVAVDMTGGFSLKYDGAKLGLNGFDLAIGNVSWGAGRSTLAAGLDFNNDDSFLAPVRGDRIPNLAADNGHVGIEFLLMSSMTGKTTNVKKGDFAPGKDISLRAFFLDDTTGAFKQGKNASERLTGGSKDDLIVGQGGGDKVYGKGGRDTLMLGRGDDKGYGGSAGDVITGYSGDDRLSGQGGADKLFGGGDRDMLFGGSGKDKLYGDEGRDRLDGGKGNDKLWGGAGKDVFVFKIKGDKDTVKDFGFGKDRLKLDDKLFGNLTAEQVVSRYADEKGRDIVFDFGSGDKLVLEDYGDIDSLADFIDII